MATAAVVAIANVSGCGDTGDEGTGQDGNDSRRVEIRMVDMAFAPKEIVVREGHTVRRPT